MKAHKPIVGVTFDSLVMIKSLENTEADTTAILQESIQGHLDANNKSLMIIERCVSNADEFLEAISELIEAAEKGLKPLVNVDCHGDMFDGLVFSDGSILSWAVIAESLTQLNRATEFNLIAVFSACFGAHFISSVDALTPAPFALMVASNDEIYPDELLRGLRAFYNKLFDTLNVLEAVKALHSERLQNGSWFVEFADTWYLEVVTAYIKHHCTKSQCRKRVQDMHAILKAEQITLNNKPMSLGYIKGTLKQANRKKLINEHFEQYFMVDSIPTNSLKYAHVKEVLMARLVEFRRTGKYLV